MFFDINAQYLLSGIFFKIALNLVLFVDEWGKSNYGLHVRVT